LAQWITHEEYNRGMKSIYNITKGQLITLWIFGGILWLLPVKSFYYAFWVYGSDDWLDVTKLDDGYFLLLLVPAILIFYTIGWRNVRKDASG